MNNPPSFAFISSFIALYCDWVSWSVSVSMPKPPSRDVMLLEVGAMQAADVEEQCVVLAGTGHGLVDEVIGFEHAHVVLGSGQAAEDGGQ